VSIGSVQAFAIEIAEANLADLDERLARASVGPAVSCRVRSGATGRSRHICGR
jgi:hypothetical protein